MIDTHCHILPGLDDGPADLETSLAMARIAERDGIRVIIATPHADPEDEALTPDIIRARTAELNEALRREGIGVTILPGAENQLHLTLVEELKAGKVMTLADRGAHVLIELPFNGYPNYVADLFFKVQLLGVTPVLAHPERAILGRSDPALIEGLAQRGAMLQLNVDSLLGNDGKLVRNLAQRLIREGFAHTVASDAHDPKRRRPILSPLRKALRRVGGDEAFRRLTEENPGKIAGV